MSKDKPIPADPSSQKVAKPKIDKPIISVPLEGRKSIASSMMPVEEGEGSTGQTPLLIYDQIEDARKTAKQSGMRVRRRFNKRQFIKQFPGAGNDPRMAFTPEYFSIDIDPMATLTVGELRDMCLAVREHPLALQKAMQVEGLADGTVIHILKQEYVILRNAAK